MAAYGFPEKTVVIKPIDGRGGRGLFVFCGHDSPPDWMGGGARETRLENANLDDAMLFSRVGDGPRMVMPCLSTPAYDVDVLAHAGAVKGIVVRRRTNPTGIPFIGNTIIADSGLSSYCAKIAEVLELDALHDMDMMSDAEGPVLLEVNPRPSGSVLASHIAGFPLIDAAVGAKIGIEVPIEQPNRNFEILGVRKAILA